MSYLKEINNVDYTLKESIKTFGNERIENWKSQFSEVGIVNIPNILPHDLWNDFKDETIRIVENNGVEKDILIEETDNSPRLMTTVSNENCRLFGDIIPKIYDSLVFQDLLTNIAGEKVLKCPIEDEQIAISLLKEPGNTHGWHWDDFSFGLVWIVESPDPSHGGFIQCIPNTTWNKKEPNVFQTILDNPIRSYSFPVGSFYFFRSGTTLHRVHPLTKKTRRLIVNMDWASEADLSRDIDISTTSAIYG